jgi:hypothetical protein
MSSGFLKEKHIKAIEFPHFPTRQQAIVWRNWEMVPVERIAKALNTNKENILKLAEEMGLNIPPDINEYWLERGYITIIRQNWHLLTYKQILILLDWTKQKLEYTLKEDDFLFHKLGHFKPEVEEVVYSPLSQEEKAQTVQIRELIKEYFPETKSSSNFDPFGFLKDFVENRQSESIYFTQCEEDRVVHDDEIIIDDSWNIELSNTMQQSLGKQTQIDIARVNIFVDRFIDNMRNMWGIKLTSFIFANKHNSDENSNKENPNVGTECTRGSTDCKIILDIKPDSSLMSESHIIEIYDNSISITAVDEVGLLRGLQWIENQMKTRGGPCLKKQIIKRKNRFDIRYIYSYFAVYGDPLLDPELDPYPDGLLSHLSDIGVNGVWLQAVLYNMVPWDKKPELSEDWEKRIQGLRDIVKRAGDYGIGVYLYINEPRAMPEEFFNNHPEWKGSSHLELKSLCTSNKDIQDYLRNGVAKLFNEVPDLAGLFTITMSENHTNCYSHVFAGNKPDCPRCSKRSQAEVIAEVNNIIAEGAHSVKPDARVIAWMWGWNSKWSDEAISLLNDDVIVMCTSEEAMPTNISGVRGEVIDYTISIPGPGKRAVSNWSKAAASGHKTAAKVQLNNTWECSAVPYLPVIDLVAQHLDGLVKSDINGLMLSWTLGGYPSLNLEYASQIYWDEDIIRCNDENGSSKENKDISSIINVFIKQKYGDIAAPHIRKAWNTFSSAFKEFPFNIGVLYTAPQNYGPMNLLHEKPTGYKATMIGFPYDDIDTWRAIYPEDIFEEQFRKLSEMWKTGLNYVDEAKEVVEAQINKESRENRGNGDDIEDKEGKRDRVSINKMILESINELDNVSRAAYCHFRSTYLQVRFVRLRNTLLKGEALKSDNSKLENIINNIINVLDEEVELAKILHDIISKDSRIGYEASNHYYYTPRDLQEKVINCEYLKKRYLNIRNQYCLL